MQSKTSSEPVIPYDLILTLYVRYIPITKASSFFRLCRYFYEQQDNYWNGQARIHFPKAIGNEGNNATVIKMGRKLRLADFLSEFIENNSDYFEYATPFAAPFFSKNKVGYSIGCQERVFSVGQIAPLIWRDEPESFFAAICEIGFTPAFFSHRGDFNSAGNRLNFYETRDPFVLEQDVIGFLPILIALKREKLFIAVVKAYLFLYQDINIDIINSSLDETHYLSFDVFFNMIVIADSKEQERGFFIRLLLSLIFETSYTHEHIIVNTLQLCKNSGLSPLACAELFKLKESSELMTDEAEKEKIIAKWRQLKALFEKNIANFEELLLEKEVTPAITANQQSLLQKGMKSFVNDELDKYPEYIIRKNSLLDLDSWFFADPGIVFQFKKSSLQFRVNKLLPFIKADDAKHFFTTVTPFEPSIFCLENPQYSTQRQVQEQEQEQEKSIKPYDLGFVCFLPIMVKLNRVAIFESLAQAYLMIYQNMSRTAFNDKPHLQFRAIFNLVKDADIEAEAKGLFMQKMIGIAFKCGIEKDCFIWEILDIAKEYDLLHLVKEELTINSSLDIKQLETIFEKYSLNYQQFFPEIEQRQHYKLR